MKIDIHSKIIPFIFKESFRELESRYNNQLINEEEFNKWWLKQTENKFFPKI